MTLHDVTVRDTTGARRVSHPQPRPRRRTLASYPWRGNVLAVGALLSAFAGLHVVLQDISWWLVGAAFVVGIFLVTAVARMLLRAWWAPTVIAIVASVLGVTAGWGGSAAFLGLIPTWESGAAVNAVINAGWESIQEQRVPARPDPGIVLLLALLMIACALAADALINILTAPALLAIPLLTLLAVPVLVRPDLANPFWYLLAGGLFLAILRIGRRSSTVGVMILVGALALGGGLLAPTFLPQVQEEPGPIGGGVQTGINPLINLGDDLRRGDAVLALTYQTTGDAPVYLRLATLDTFNGRSWVPPIVDGDPDHLVTAFPAPEGLGVDISRVSANADVQVGDIAGRWLPLPYPAKKVDGVDGDWYWERSGLSARSTNAGVRGQTYTVDYVEVEPTLAQVMESVPHTDPGELATLALPARIPDIVESTALEIGGDLPTSYERAIALQNFFLSGDFTYSEDAPVEKGYDGTGVEILARFLQEKSGYCVHFASAMAVMARILGIPSRVAVGFQPGEPVSAGGATSYSVSSHDLHAWPELYFDGVGWLRFEPTPGRGSVPDYTGTGAVDDPTTPQDEGASPEPTATSSSTGGPNRPDEDIVDAAGGGTGTKVASPLPVVLGVIALLIVLSGFGPAVIRLIVRRRRVTAIRRGRDPASAAWAELRDTARDYGWAAPDSETPRDFADRLAVVLTGDRDRIDGFRTEVEESAFAPPGRGAPTVRELTAMRRAIAKTVSVRDRVRAVFLPASLLARFRWDPEG